MFKTITSLWKSFIIIGNIKIRPRDIFLQKMYSFIGSLCAYALKSTPITPNQVTVFGFITGVGASILFLKQEYPFLIIASFLIQITLLTDYTDGILARHKKKSSVFGGWLDFAIDRSVDIILIFGITLGIFLKTNEHSIFILGYVAVSSRLMINLTHYSFEKIIPQGAQIIVDSQKSGLLKEFFYTRVLIHLSMSLFALVNKMELYLLLLAIYGVLFWLGMIFYCGYLIKKMIKEGVIR